MTLKVTVLQSNYLPWIGYFDLISKSDVCVFYDDVQYTKNDWRNRNRILSENGLEWITVPVGQSIHRKICEVGIADSRWQEKHYAKLLKNYSVATRDSFSNDLLNSIYKHTKWTNLSLLNQETIKLIAQKYLKIRTTFDSSIYYDLEGKSETRLISLLKQMKATHYLSGPAGSNYLNPVNFAAAGISLEYFNYPDYPEYDQVYKPFQRNVSVVDLLLTIRDRASNYLDNQEMRRS
jgi:hypothetical protein